MARLLRQTNTAAYVQSHFQAQRMTVLDVLKLEVYLPFLGDVAYKDFRQCHVTRDWVMPLTCDWASHSA